MLVESYSENNYTANLALKNLNPVERRDQHYWLGLASLDDLKTNTLESASGLLFSQYAGKTTEKYLLFLLSFSILLVIT